MSRRASALTIGILAFLSGIPALVYQVVWTRQVALIAGGQIEALSVVLVAFFGGLALGTHYFGVRSDRTPTPLRLYAALEIGAGLLAATSVWTLRELGSRPHFDAPVLLGMSVILLVPSTFLLGGTLPSLLRSLTSEPSATPGRAGMLVGANTAGAILGVAVAVAAIPTLGLRSTLLAAVGGAFLIGVASFLFARSHPRSIPLERQPPHVPSRILAAAFLVGAATLGFEVLAARMASMRLGSSLYAWGLVLGLFLLGLAAGNFALSRRARTSATPTLDLGALEVMAACSVAFGLAILRPDMASPTAALSFGNLGRVALAVLPATLCMGGAFPLLVRLAVRDLHIGGAFGRLSALNTIGGVVGALVTPFVLLPALGSIPAGMTLAAANAGVGLFFLATAKATRIRMLTAALCLSVAATTTLRTPTPAEDPWVLFISEGRQATAVVTGSSGNRTLIVDGDPEASTAGHARHTEELLAVLPLLLHPMPERFLEIGLGSGITLGTATRFPLERIDCVEIAGSVVRAARYFEPDNRNALESARVELFHADARRHLARKPNTYDVISANTLHPWSIGATGLYSREYFSRIAGALRPGGIAVQWLPTEQISKDSLSIILRTFFDVFPEGDLWWGAGNIIAMGSLAPIPDYDAREADRRLDEAQLSWQRLGWVDAEELTQHRIADAQTIRAVLGSGELLQDDRPRLEFHAARGRVTQRSGELYETLAAMAKAGSTGNDAMVFWLESLARHASGDESGAEALEKLASTFGLRIAQRADLARQVERAYRDIGMGRSSEARRAFDSVLAIDPDQRYARFGRAGLAIERGDIDSATRDLETIVSTWSGDVRAWNALAGLYTRSGKSLRARHAVDQALAANPFDLGALVNAGLIASKRNDRSRARNMLIRVRAISPLGQSEAEARLVEALGQIAEP